ncbi:HPr family phosphocarrier protein [Cognaticolwellia beringensis]|uniref:HPr family phosphocarrier protein n=1 Tax=Cognaticolwellia beringensis TaxID=1967665 RepID=A0A222G6N7_9GAMM|nr:HPr family phosphocarrier protein [Cognaticolwellia beringensis]ASP47460.1 HPr family phosphocarrier protein [Cognaticolwellia beringensis]|tara:strand:- start:18428 stop:18706 length:279 start_codon:yes stop_codon:yes gene_type:complete
MSAQASRKVLIINKLGLHARAASKLAQLSQKFTAKVTIELDENRADANSIMGLMLLAGAQGKTVKVIASGVDAEIALEEICQLFSNRFDEAE